MPVQASGKKVNSKDKKATEVAYGIYLCCYLIFLIIGKAPELTQFIQVHDYGGQVLM